VEHQRRVPGHPTSSPTRRAVLHVPGHIGPWLAKQLKAQIGPRLWRRTAVERLCHG
jgi:hypothetical protein